MATIKVYLPTDSLQVYFDSIGGVEKQITAGHLRMYNNTTAETITIKDEINSTVIRDRPHAEILNEAGSAAGGDYDAVVLYLAKIIG